MPPKPKCSREDIINAAYDIMHETGIESDSIAVDSVSAPVDSLLTK